jgi:hypothetical protein
MSLGSARRFPVLPGTIGKVSSLIGIITMIASCRSEPEASITYRLATVDDSMPPVTMFPYAGGSQTQLMEATIKFSSDGHAIYDWQYRILQPDGGVDTLEPGADTFAVTARGDERVFMRYRLVGFDTRDSVLQADTAWLRERELLLRERLELGDTVVYRHLRFVQE